MNALQTIWNDLAVNTLGTQRQGRRGARAGKLRVKAYNYDRGWAGYQLLQELRWWGWKTIDREFVGMVEFVVIVALGVGVYFLKKKAKETKNHVITVLLKADDPVSILGVVPSVIGPLWRGEYELDIDYDKRERVSLAVSVNNKTPEVLGSILKALRDNGISARRCAAAGNKDFAAEYQ